MKKRASSFGAAAAASAAATAAAASTARRRSGAPAPKPVPMDESSEEDEDDRMEVEEEGEEEERPPRGRAAAGGAGSKRASRGGGGGTPPKRARRQRQEEEEEEVDGEGADDEDDYVDPRFHNPPAATAAAPMPAPAPRQQPSTGGGRLSWGDPTSYLPSFWGRSYGGGRSSSTTATTNYNRNNASPAVGGGGGYTWPPPPQSQPQQVPRPSLSPSKRVAFRDEVETFEGDDGDDIAALAPPPPRGRRSLLGEAGGAGAAAPVGVRRRSSGGGGAASHPLHLPPSPSASPVRSILKKPRPSLDAPQQQSGAAAGSGEGDGRISFLRTLGGRVVAKLAFPLLGLTVAAAWALALGALALGLRGLLWREGCPPGQVREGPLGLWGDCVVSTRTVRQLVRALEHATVARVCADMPWAPWGSAYGRPGALAAGSPLIPDFDVGALWAEPLGIWEYPWADLEERGVQRAWQGSFNNTRATLWGRAPVLRALWREWALPCRCKLLLAERWGWAAGLLGTLLVVAWVALAARRQRRALRDAERVKRVVLDLLAAEGEVAPEHARDELLQHLGREYRHLGLSRGALKGLWPRVARLVERDSRVTKAPRERHGRAIPHWIWVGRRASGMSALGGGLHRHHHQPLKPIHEEGEGARAVVI